MMVSFFALRPLRAAGAVLLALALLLPTVVMADAVKGDPADMAAMNAEDPTAVILGILRDKGDISEARYQELMDMLARKEQAPAVAPAAPVAKAEKPAYRVFWKGGPRMESTDGDVKFRLSGRIHNQYGYIWADDDIENSFGDVDNFRGFFRRARLGVAGTLYDRWGFKAEYDFAGGDVDFADVYVEAKKVPVAGTITVGHFKQPLSVDEMTSTNNNWFIERSQANEAFYGGRDTGLLLRNGFLDKRVTISLSGQVGANSSGDSPFDDEFYTFIGRVTGLPWVDADGNVLHLGAGWRHTFLPSDGTVRFRSRPETAVTNVRFVDTGDIAAESADLLVGEAALAYGPWNAVFEYFGNFVDAETGGDPYFSGFYGLVSYFLTGDKRPYNRTRGGFSSVKIADPMTFKDGGGYGAWELAGRFSRVDLNDESIKGGKQNIYTAGLNWYPIGGFRFMLNYSYVDVSDSDAGDEPLDDGSAHVVQSRFQVNF